MYEIWEAISPVVWNLLLVIVIVFVGKKFISIAVNMVKKATERAGLEHGVTSFLTSLTKIALYIIIIVIVAGILGIPTASFIALISSCGLAVGLALQGSLQNFAGGVLILLMKPFVVGDYIIAKGMEGTVDSIDICYTKLRTIDNKIAIIPNGTLSNSELVNVSREPIRRVDLTVPISYTDNIKAVKSMLLKLAENCQYVLPEKEVNVFVSEFGNDSIIIGFRVWCETEHYWDTKFQLQEQIKEAMDANGFTIPFHQVDVFMKNEK
ncbi:MAG: mechanosensitive ion channel family protein [Lachnospiraceae bacterium]